MAPEQARGDDVDHRADIWSFCVVLYEALTGTQPFLGKNDNALLYAILAHEPAPITSLAAGDAELAKILEKGFKKNPDKRWQSIHELGSALAAWLVAQGVTEDIAGTSIEATWLSQAEGRTNGLSTRPPPMAIHPRDATTERPPPEPPLVPRRFVFAGIAVLVVGAIAFGVGRRAEPVDAPRDSLSSARAEANLAPRPPAASASVPVAPEPAESAPSPSDVGSTDEAAAASTGAEPSRTTKANGRKTSAKTGSPAIRSPAEGAKSKSPAGHGRPGLKDPFQ
jgi:hypothetical protein